MNCRNVDYQKLLLLMSSTTTRPHCSQKVIAKRGTRCIEIVQEHSKTNISLMFCGSADGKLLPPYVIYKSQSVYVTWTQGAPRGTVFNCSKSGWFDKDSFAAWFRDTLIPAVWHLHGENFVISDNLAAHFSVEVIEMAAAYNIKFIALPPNSTHLLQPLDVAVFRTVKAKWRIILQSFGRESRATGPIPKQSF